MGAAGFLIDGGLLAALTYGLGAGPVWSRLVSASVAIAGTFWLNRVWSFSDAEPRPLSTAFRNYLAVQGTGFVVNVLIYMAVIRWGQGLLQDPLVALAVASAGALAVNYAGSRLFVFRPQARTGEEKVS